MAGGGYPVGRLAQLDDLTERQLDAARPWRDGRLAMLGDLLRRAGDLEQARDQLFEWMAQAAPVSVWSSLHEGLVLCQLAGLYDAMPGGPLGMRVADDPLSLPYPEATRWYRQKRVVTAAEFEALDRDARVEAFTVAGVQDRRVVQGMHNAIQKSIDQGTGYYEFVTEVDELTEQAGSQPFKMHHLATIYDTNMASAYAAGRYQQLMRVRAARPIWTYHAIDDGHARPNHWALNGWRARWDDPAWADRYPPNGFRCRCGVTSETEAEAAAAGWDGEGGAPTGSYPDRGFEGSPALMQEARQVGRRIAGEVRDRGLLPGTAVDERRYRTATTDAARAALYRRGLEALARSQDPARLATLRSFTPLTTAELAAELRTTSALNLYAPDVDLAPDHLVAHLNMYSQNTGTLLAMVRRIVTRPELSSVRDRIQVRSKISVFRNYDRTWEAVEQAFDDDVARALGDVDPTAWSSEVILEIPLEDKAQAEALAQMLELDFTVEQSGAVALSWYVPDLRFLGPGAAEAAPGPMLPMVLNTRTVGEGRISTLSSAPLEGWESSPVAVNRSLAEIVREGEASDVAP